MSIVKEDCEWYRNGDCGKGLLGTPCDIVGCVVYRPNYKSWLNAPDTSGIVRGDTSTEVINDLMEKPIKAVKLKDGTLVTEGLAKEMAKASLFENMIFENALASYREKLAELPPPPPGYYYAPKMGEIRHEGDQYICEGYISLEPIIKYAE